MNFLLEARIMIQTRREELLLKSIQFQAKAITEEILRFIQTAQTEVLEILSRKFRFILQPTVPRIFK